MLKPSTGVVLRPTSSTQTLSQVLAMLRMEERLPARQLWAQLKHVLGSTLWCGAMPGPQQHLTAPSSITYTQCKEGEKAGHSERGGSCALEPGLVETQSPPVLTAPTCTRGPEPHHEAILGCVCPIGIGAFAYIHLHCAHLLCTHTRVQTPLCTQALKLGAVSAGARNLGEGFAAPSAAGSPNPPALTPGLRLSLLPPCRTH